MVAPYMEPTLDEWIIFCNKLTPYENFALIGLLFLRPHPPLSILVTADIVSEENTRAAEKWSESNLRKLLLFYCDNYKRPGAEAAAALVDKADAVKGLAPLLVSTLAVPVGIAAAFLFWALGKRLDDWCQKYSRKKFNGKGKYMGNFPEKQVDSFFEVTYLPPIVELVEDPAAYPLEVYKIQVKVEAETDGRIKVSTPKELNSIQFSFTGQKSHSFSFTDTLTSGEVSGHVDNVSHVAQDGPLVLRFVSSDMRAEPSSKL
jgi:hypothetical protein